MLQKAPNVTISSILSPTHVPAVMEFMKTTGLGYKPDLHADDDTRDGSGSESEERRGRRDGSGSMEERVAVERESEAEEGEERGEEEDADEWRFGLFE
jgi:hypothetical protein